MTASSPAAGAMAPGASRRGIRGRLRDARIRTKLALILVIPIVAVLALATDRIVQHGQEALDTELVRSLAALSSDAAAVVEQVHRERMLAATFLADSTAKPDQYIPQIRETDRAIAAYSALRNTLGAVPASVGERLQRIDEQLKGIDLARQQVLTRGDLTVSAVMLRYGAVAEDLVTYREAIGQLAGDTPLGDSLRAVAALSKAKLQMAQAQATAFVALLAGSLDAEQLTSFLSTQTSQQESLSAFALAATPQQRAFVAKTITGDAVSLADHAANDVIRSAGRELLITAADASRSLGAVVDLVRWAEKHLDSEVVELATQARNQVIWQVIGDAAAVLLVIAMALALALMLARVLIRSLNELRVGTLAVASRDLPETVARLSDRRTVGDHTPAEIAARVPDPIQLSTRDEIGEVAQAFNAVHREAVRVAAEQAALHTSVSVMFLNLARRSQSLVDQMIAHLDDIERDEEDPTRLGRLFRLDHLATRMRRNDENLLVLAGADSSPARREDGLLIDILRAAQSEIEHYDRVEFGSVDMDALVVARAVNDVVRLLAELIDNATRFSPPGAAVVVSARHLGDQLMIQIEDRGVGIPADQVALFNARLAEPPTMDISAFRMMGLAVSGRLAARYSIRVELRCDTGEGTMVYVTLPSNIVILPRPRQYDGHIPSQRRIGGPAPRQLPPAVTAPVTPMWHEMIPGALPTGPAAGRSSPQHNGSVPQMVAPTTRPAAELLAVPSYAAPPGSATDETAEMPIYQEMEAAWFRDNRSLQMDAGPTGATGVTGPGGQWPGAASWQQPASAPTPSYPASAYRSPATSAAPMASGDAWHTAADDGWRAAMAAAEPVVQTKTRGGLPKRVPQAQLVPGGVHTPAAAGMPQRSPEDVRGLLSAYHRGVQRGRGAEPPPVSG